jgi:hypothetical protein
MALLEVDPGGLRAAAGGISEAAGLVANGVPVRRPDLAGPTGADWPNGWESDDVLTAAVQVWSGYLDGLGDELRAAGAAVRASADAYVVTDRTADSVQRRAARGIAW